jgi:putative NIF3 family GTP cyclohydrolase 1 type 2
MHTNDIREYFLSHSPRVDPSQTVDTVKAGDPTRPVSTVAVGWFASLDDIKAAVGLGCGLFITHEPTFWDHAPAESRWRSVEPAITKQKLLDESGIVVLRCHDCWDNWPGIGIRDSWAAWLGLGDPIAESEDKWHATYAIEPARLREFAAGVAARIKPLGEDSVSVMGDPDRIVSRPAVGVGCGGPDKDMIDEGADVLIVCYDGAGYWSARERLFELGAAVITVEHGTSEMPGLMNLANHLGEAFPELTVHYLDKHPRTWTVKPKAG